MKKELFTYICENCGSIYSITKDIMLCPSCREDDLEGKPLKGVLKVQIPKKLHLSKKPGDNFDIFEYLPVEKEYFPQYLQVGNTPIIKAPSLERSLGSGNIYLKFDGTNPTGSFKDRASWLVSAFAKKNGLNEIALASTGNAASSMSGIGAAAGQKIYVFMPSSAPKAKLVQCLQYDARLIPIIGSYDKAYDLSLKFSARTGILSRNTAYNPLTIEGKKTVSFELVSQLRPKNIDFVFLPAGDGVILSGVIKGFADMLLLGLIEKIPQIIAVQAEKSSYLYNAFHDGNFDPNYKASTLADSISVNAARNAYCAVNDLKAVEGNILKVSDEEILDAQKNIAANTGIFCEPSSAVTLAGMRKFTDHLSNNSNIVLLLTGHGLKDVESASKGFPDMEVYEPDIDIILKSIKC